MQQNLDSNSAVFRNCLIDDVTILVRREITDTLGGMTMKIRKWVSNSCEILDTVPPEDRYPTLNDSNNMIS